MDSGEVMATNPPAPELSDEEIDKIFSGPQPPAEMTDEEMAKAEANPAAKPESWYQKSFKSTFPTYLPGLNVTIPMGTTVIPSAESAAEALPAIGAGAGAAVGAPAWGVGAVPGAALGGTAGEALRQLARRLMGAPAATSMGQEAMGLDPNSLEASVIGLGEEALGGGLAEKGAQLGGRILAPKLKKLGARWLASSALPASASERTVAKTAESLEPIAKDVPIGTRRSLAKLGEQKAEEAGAKVSEAYAEEIPIGIEKPSGYLREESEKTLLRKGKPATGAQKELPPVVLDPDMRSALKSRLGEMTKIAKDEALRGEPITLPEMKELRSQAGLEAKRASRKAFESGERHPDITPEASSWEKTQRAYSDVMHEATGSDIKAGIKGAGEQADDLFHGWATIRDMGDQRTNILARWLVSRFVPGAGGIVAGGAVASPALTGSAVNRGAQLLASALEKGDKAGVVNILRGLEALASGPTHSGTPK